MKLRKKIVSILLACVLLCAMLPAANAALLPTEETYDFTLDTVTAYNSISAVMLLRANVPVSEEVTLTITYDPNAVIQIGAINGLLYQGDLYGEDGPLQIDLTNDNGLIRLTLNAGNFTGPGVVVGFLFGLMEGVSEASVHLEAVKADGTPLSTKDGLIQASDVDDSVISMDQNDRLFPAFPIGTCVGALDNTSVGQAKAMLQPASGCSLEAYGPSGDPLADGDRLGTGCILTSKKEDKIVSQAVYLLLGDLDGNGLTDASDALLALQSSVELTSLSYIQTAVADCDVSGAIDASDALTMLQYSVGLIPYCVGITL